MSLPPNWTCHGTEPDRDAVSSPAAPTACLHLGPERPGVRRVDWTPCPLDLLPGATFGPSAVGCPSPELRANWDWPPARARPH